MARWTKTFPSYNTLYSYVQVDNWETHGDRCTFDLSGGITSPYYWNVNGISCEIGWWESGTYHPIDTDTASYNRNGGDVVVFDFSDYFTRQAADRTIYLYHEGQASGTAYAESSAYTVPHLAPSVTWAASNPVVRNSDNSITLTWDAPSLEYSAMCLEVSTDGGSWSQFAVLWNTATSYTWTGCSAGHSYQFRIRTNYLASYSAYDTCATVIVNTPLPPESISTAAAGGTSVTVNLVNPSAVATKVQYQVSNDDGATWGATQDSASLTSFTVTITGTGKVKAWNYNATGVSAAIETESITTICPPAKPSINSPQSGDVWDVSKPLVVSWVHNSLDGSAQSAAKITLVKAGTPPVSHVETLDPYTGNTYSIDFATAQGWISGLAVGDVLNVAVKTKGADASYSSNTVVNGIKAYTAPTLNITSPSASVTSMPVSISATYSDMAGFTCQAATVTLKSGDRTILTKPATISGTSLSCEISPSDALLDNGATYTIVLDVRSSSGLQSTANASFTTAFTEPQAGELSITNDPDTGYASLLATFDNSASEITYTGATNTQYESTEGYVRSLTVEGKSEKWNQLVPHGNFDSMDGWSAGFSNATKSLSGGVITLTAGQDVQAKNILFRHDVPVIWSHKYFITGKAKASSGVTGTMRLYATQVNTISITPSTSWQTFEAIRDGLANVDPAYFAFDFEPQVNLTAGSTIDIKECAFIDLTAIFGRGNEPTTVEAFKATDVYKAKLAAGELYDYDAGSLVSIEGAGVVGRNLLEGCGAEATGSYPYGHNYKTNPLYLPYVIPAGTQLTFSFEVLNEVNAQCGIIPLFTDGTSSGSKYTPTGWTTGRKSSTFSWDKDVKAVGFYTSDSTTRVKEYQLEVGSTAHAYEPYSLATIPAPLRSAGSVHDTLMADADSWTVGRKVGVVDLGSLTWTVRNGVGMQTGGLSSLIKSPSANDKLPNVMMPNATPMTWTALVNSGTSSGGVGVSGGYLAISTTETNAATFKTAMSGVYLFYELATPTTDPETSMSRIEIGSAFTVATDLDSTFEMTTWDGSADAVSVSVSRVNADGTITPLLEDGQAGAGIVDKYAPLNTPYQYAVTTMSAAHAVNTVYVDNLLRSDRWFAYWTKRRGEEISEEIASAKWNPANGGIKLTRPQRERVFFAGRADPVSFDGPAVSMAESPSWLQVEKEDADKFVQLIQDGGRGVYKSCDGWVYHADFELTLNPAYIAVGYYGSMLLNITRIAGGLL